MAAPASRGSQAGAAAALLLAGLVVLGAGTAQLRLLERTHQPTDLLHAASPRLLQAWIRTLDPADPDSATRLADRLLVMTLPQRRDAVTAMADLNFLARPGAAATEQRQIQHLVLAGVLDALSRAPAPGELWYLAGRLRSQLHGLDAIAGRYFELSYLNAPRELDIVLARLRTMGAGWKLLDDRARDIVRRDLAVASEAYPASANELRAFLQRAGADL